ncbi:MAG: hypothetical protein N4A45_00245 [Flavobacteriales bacterium]|jgi:hypothetical protein|nr:hypothetical protein [Flavobacteriales bacterium]
MLEQLIQSFKGEALGQLMGQFGMSEKEADQSVDVVGEEVQSSVSNQLSSGNISGLLNMFGDADGDGIPDVLEGIGENVISGLVSKVGFSQEKAGAISEFVLPMAVKFFGGKMKKESDDNGVDMMDLIGQFVGGGASKESKKDEGLLGGIGDALGGLFK